MRVGIVSPYLATMGGGERYVFSVAEYFADRGDTVEIFTNQNINAENVEKRFDLKLAKVRFVPDTLFRDDHFLKRLWQTKNFDLMFFLSDGSIPTSLAANNILHFQVPFNFQNQRTLANKIKLSRFQHIVCNSKFTKKFIDQTYGVESRVVYPPVDVEKFSSGKKENIILSVGRFFAPSNPKKQEVMIEAFKKLSKNKKGWKLILLGGVTEDSRQMVSNLENMTKSYSIEIITEPSFDTIRDYYCRAKIYWHAAGYGEDLEIHPDRAEHFGITTVEAMAAGAVPVVFAGGGQIEIVEEGVSGFFWTEVKELLEKTTELMENEKERGEMAIKAISRAKEFSKERFRENMAQLLPAK